MQPENPQPPFPEGAKRPYSPPDPQQSQQAPPPPPPGWSDPRADRWAARQQRRQDRWQRRGACRSNPGSGLFFGLFITLIGVAFLLRNLNIIYFDDIGRFWPVILIGVGISKLTSPYNNIKWTGLAFAGFGTLLLMNNFHLLPFNPWQSFWPLVLIVVGVSLLLRHMDGGGPSNGPPGGPPPPGWGGGGPSSMGPMGPGSSGPGSSGPSPGTANFSSGSAAYNAGSYNSKNFGVGEPDTKRLFVEVVFSGVQRKITSQEFEGGKISAAFSGVQIDLREANTKLDQLTLQCDAVFGGIDIWIPDTWSVDLRGTGVFGAFHNQTFVRPPRPSADGSPARNPRVTITGGAVFGGVTIKN